jgi:hypothetical protein
VLPLFEIALVLVRLNHVASFIVNANHSVMNIQLGSAVLIAPSTVCKSNNRVTFPVRRGESRERDFRERGGCNV